jgi:germination protein M
MAELFSIGSIVNTLTQFEGVNKVKILVEGEEFIGPSGEPLGFMTEYPLEP